MPPGIALSDFYYILPEIVLTAGALILLVADVLLPRGSKILTWVAIVALGATALSLLPFRGVHVEKGAIVKDSKKRRKREQEKIVKNE